MNISNQKRNNGKRAQKHTERVNYEAVLEQNFTKEIHDDDGAIIFIYLLRGQCFKYDYKEDYRLYAITFKNMTLFFTEEKFSSIFRRIDSISEYGTMENIYKSAESGDIVFVHDFDKDETIPTSGLQDGDTLVLVTDQGRKYDFNDYDEKWAAFK